MLNLVQDRQSVPYWYGEGTVLPVDSGLYGPGARNIGGAVRYLHGILAGSREERLHAVFFDAHKRYLHDRTLVVGGLGEVTLRARNLLQEAFSIKAFGIVLAHNHLSGICRPSAADIESTGRLVALCRAVDIELIDHFIFTAERGFSMRMGGYL